jgi:hypothetical protein
MALRDASADPICRRARSTEQMREPGQRDRDAEDGEQKCRCDVRYQPDRAGYGPDRTGCDRDRRRGPFAARAKLQGDDPVADPVTPMKLTSAAGARS